MNDYNIYVTMNKGYSIETDINSYSNFEYKPDKSTSSSIVTQPYEANENSCGAGILNNVPTISLD